MPARTIRYVLNPFDQERVATVVENFQNGSDGWLNDQEDSMVQDIRSRNAAGYFDLVVK